MTVGPDGRIYLSNGNYGLWIYNFDGSTFNEIAHIDNGGMAYEVVIGANGTIFLANRFDGLRAYTLDGNTLTNTAHANYSGAKGVAIGSDGTVFLANGGRGLYAFTYSGSSFDSTARWSANYCDATDIAIGSDGTIFLADAERGLWAFTFDGSSFNNTAHIDDGGNPRSVGVDSDGTIFLANWGKGLFAYTYSTITSFNSENKSVPNIHSLSQNYPNPFNPVTKIHYSLAQSGYVQLKVYNLLGKEVATLVDEYKTAGNNFEVTFDGSNLSSGVYFYRIQSGKFIETKKMVLMK